MYDDIKLAIVGAGKWGINHVKTAYNVLGPNLKIVCDINPELPSKVKIISQEIDITNSIEKVIKSNEINSVIIATPAETHFEIAKLCLINNKNILVEKPLTLLSSETEELIQLAKKKSLILMVGHVLLYHPAIIKIKKLIDENFIGHIQYIYSNRLNLGTIRQEENILWSFAPHDISVIQYLLGKNPIEVNAYGATFLQHNIEDSTITILKYPGNIHAHIFVSWLHPFKEQRLVIIGDKGMLVFEDSLPKEKLKYYQKGYSISNGQIKKFESDYEVIEFENKMPLQEEHIHFYESIINKKNPLTDGYHAKSVLEILEMASLKLK